MEGLAVQFDSRPIEDVFCFALDGLRLCHFGDFGQAALRAEEQRSTRLARSRCSSSGFADQPTVAPLTVPSRGLL
jgi:hypothetical protein